MIAQIDWRGFLDGFGQLAFLRLDLLLRLVLAAVLGGVIGLEREISGKPAGLRTNLLICVGAALLTELSITIARAADPIFINADPARIAAQIVSGIGFLGAGTIIQARGSVVGLTTAATLWVVAAIGIAVGAGAYIEAIGTTLLVIIALIILGRAEGHLIRRRAEGAIEIILEPNEGLIGRVEDVVAAAGFEMETLELEKHHDRYRASVMLTGPRRRREDMMLRLLTVPGVLKVSRL